MNTVKQTEGARLWVCSCGHLWMYRYSRGLFPEEVSSLGGRTGIKCCLCLREDETKRNAHLSSCRTPGHNHPEREIEPTCEVASR